MSICSEEDAGRVLDEYFGPNLQLMEQTLELEDRTLKLIVPRSSDAVMDFYINEGLLRDLFLKVLLCQQYFFKTRNMFFSFLGGYKVLRTKTLTSF